MSLFWGLIPSPPILAFVVLWLLWFPRLWDLSLILFTESSLLLCERFSNWNWICSHCSAISCPPSSGFAQCKCISLRLSLLEPIFGCFSQTGCKLLRAEPSTARIVLRHLSRGASSSLPTSFTLLVLLDSLLASAKPAWLNFGQHRGPIYSYNSGSKKRQNWCARFTLSIADNKHNTKGYRAIKTKDLNKNWLATWQSNGLLANKQKGCRKGCQGTKYQLLVDKAILKNCGRGLTNLSRFSKETPCRHYCI